MRKNICLISLLIFILSCCHTVDMPPYTTMMLVQFKSETKGYLLDDAKIITKPHGVDYLDPSPLLYKGRVTLKDNHGIIRKYWYDDMVIQQDKDGHRCLYLTLSGDSEKRDSFIAEIEFFAPNLFNDEEFHKMIFTFSRSHPNSYKLESYSFGGISGKIENKGPLDEPIIVFSMP